MIQSLCIHLIGFLIGCAMSNIIDKKAKVLVKSGGVTDQSSVCVFQSFDGSFHGSDVRVFRILNTCL